MNFSDKDVTIKYRYLSTPGPNMTNYEIMFMSKVFVINTLNYLSVGTNTRTFHQAIFGFPGHVMHKKFSDFIVAFLP